MSNVKRSLTMLLGITAFAIMTAASAATLDFNSLAHDNTGAGVFVGPTILAGDFQIETCGFGLCGVNSLTVWSRYDALQADYGNAAVAVTGAGTVKLSRRDGGAFDFYSIDFGSYFNYISFATFNILTFDSGEIRTALVTVPQGLQTFVFDERNVHSLVIRGQGSGGIRQFDNIVLDRIAPVPEPTSYAMMLAGLGIVAFVARRRKRLTELLSSLQR